MLIAAPYSLRDQPGFGELLETVAELTDPVDPHVVREFVGSTVSSPLPPTFLETVIAECQKVPARVWRATLGGLLEGDLPATDSPGVPALLIWGDRDEICPRSEQEALIVAIPGAELATYHGVGHSPHWEKPEPVAADIAAFAERALRAQPSMETRRTASFVGACARLSQPPCTVPSNVSPGAGASFRFQWPGGGELARRVSWAGLRGRWPRGRVLRTRLVRLPRLRPLRRRSHVLL